MVQVGAARLAPGEVLGDHGRLETVDEALDAVEVTPVHALGAPDRQPDRMERQRIVGADRLEGPHRGSPAEIILRMDFQPGQRGAGRADLVDVRAPEPDSGSHRQSLPVPAVDDHPTRPRRPGPAPQARGCVLPLTRRPQVPFGTYTQASD